MSDIPRLSAEDIEPFFDEGSFERGRRYYHRGMIFEPRRQGMTLKARCSGSYNNSYRVEVTFNSAGIKHMICSCPVGGACKHTVALLLTWIDSPDEFAGVEDLDTALQKRSKAELITLVKQMLLREPELESLLEMPLPGAGKKGAPASVATFRKQAEAAFKRAENEWGDPDGIARELAAITALGDGYAQQGDYASAVAVYEGVSSVTLDNYQTYSEDDELSMVVDDCVRGLAACLEGTQDAPVRADVLRVLFAIYSADADIGGLGLGERAQELLIGQTTPEERSTIAGWVHDKLSTGETDWHGIWKRRHYGEFLLELEIDTLDDDEYIEVCRETGRIHDLVDRLLSLGRVDEALADADSASDYDLLGVADLFVEHSYGAMAEGLLRERAEKSQDARLPEWLKNRYTARGDYAAALDVARAMFRQQPSLELYREVRDLATRRDRWEPLRPTLIMFLRDNKRVDLLLRIYLDEKEIDLALETLAALRETPYGHPYSYGYSHYALDVAAAAEERRPRASIDLYRQSIEGLIAQQGRPNYQTASRLLARVRALYTRLGDEATWDAYIADLKERNRRLRALTEELRNAGV